jgi:hypothetical protein
VSELERKKRRRWRRENGENKKCWRNCYIKIIDRNNAFPSTLRAVHLRQGSPIGRVLVWFLIETKQTFRLANINNDPCGLRHLFRWNVALMICKLLLIDFSVWNSRCLRQSNKYLWLLDSHVNPLADSSDFSFLKESDIHRNINSRS